MSYTETTSPLATQPEATNPPPPTNTTSHPSLSAIQSQPLHCEHYQRLPPNLTHHKEIHRHELSTADTTGNPLKSQQSQGVTQKLLINCPHNQTLPSTPYPSQEATPRQPIDCRHYQRMSTLTRCYTRLPLHCRNNQRPHPTHHPSKGATQR